MIEDKSKKNKKSILMKLAKFIISGGAAAIVEYSSFLIFNAVIGLPIIPSNILSFIFGFFVSFLLNRQWVFRSQENISRQLYLYLILAGINLILSTILIWAITNLASTSPFISKIFVMGIIATWNYFVFSKIIFSKK